VFCLPPALDAERAATSLRTIKGQFSMSSPFRLSASLFVIAGIAACGPAKSDGVDTAKATQAAATPIPSFTKAQFASLRWIDGKWRGKTPAGQPIWDSYRMVNDSTMHQGTFTDSTYKTQRDSAVVSWRNGTVIDQGSGAPWFATALDSSGVSFSLPKSPMNRITWIHHSVNEWEAQITSPDRLGHEQRTIYHMRRFGR
jgi:hypothetical protein